MRVLFCQFKTKLYLTLKIYEYMNSIGRTYFWFYKLFKLSWDKNYGNKNCFEKTFTTHSLAQSQRHSMVDLITLIIYFGLVNVSVLSFLDKIISQTITAEWKSLQREGITHASSIQETTRGVLMSLEAYTA